MQLTPDLTVAGPVLGVGVDLVHVPAFAEQLALPGSRFASYFTAGERADIAERGGHARHWAVRWAAKEAVVKAWSASLFGEPPVTGEDALKRIEVISDAWGRPRIGWYGDVAAALTGCEAAVSLSHDGPGGPDGGDEWAIAYVVLSACSR